MTAFDHPALDQQLWQHCEQAYLANPNRYISLQDNYHTNVNLILLAEYLDAQGYFIAKASWQSLAKAIARWEEFVLIPYRTLRRKAKAHTSEDEYQKMLEVELIMERKSQQIIRAQLVRTEGESNPQQSNIAAYLSLFGLDETIISTLN
ncbi:MULTISPECIES: TIGR02444 family protein [Shewanella]|nr:MULTISPECIES: TIGR02444 family protein [Shewanella]